MSRFGFLVLPSANRVYGQVAGSLTRAELAVYAETVLAGRITGIDEDRIGGVPYVTFEASELTESDIGHLSDLSSMYALFEVGEGALRPVELAPLDRYDGDLLTIQRYTGKTNEQFTKLLVNVTFAWSARGLRPTDASASRPLLLDPVCGRGTTLNQALMYGCHAAGVDVDGRAIDAYETFIKTWLQDKRLKHRTESGRIRRDGKVVGRRFDIAIGPAKGAAGEPTEEPQRLAVVHDDTRYLADQVRRGTVDAIVGDLPYGVQHTNRDLVALLEEALPDWVTVLRAGGAIGLAWNTRMLSRDEVATRLAGVGLEPVDTEAMGSFAHRVDRSINRDLVVARKPTP